MHENFFVQSFFLIVLDWETERDYLRYRYKYEEDDAKAATQCAGVGIHTGILGS
jgi:hypothetical protein